jgi:hypothetical protein
MLDGGVDLGDFISLPQRMHRLPADSQQPRDLGVGFVQVPADDFEPLKGQGMSLGIRIGLHKSAVIYRICCREFKLYSEFHLRISWFAVKANRQTRQPREKIMADACDRGHDANCANLREFNSC